MDDASELDCRSKNDNTLCVSPFFNQIYWEVNSIKLKFLIIIIILTKRMKK